MSPTHIKQKPKWQGMRTRILGTFHFHNSPKVTFKQHQLIYYTSFGQYQHFIAIQDTTSVKMNALIISTRFLRINSYYTERKTPILCNNFGLIYVLSTGHLSYWPADLKKIPDVIDFAVVRNIRREDLSMYPSLDLPSDH